MAAGGLYRSTIASPSPTKIVAGLFGGTLALSSDDNWLVTYETAGTSFTDMYMVNTAASSSLVTLCPTETAAFFGDPFTVDDSQVLFFCNISTSGSGYVGDFDAEKLMAGATKTTVAPTNVWQANSVSGAKVLYNDHYIGGGPVYGYADIEAVDLSATPLAPTTVVSHADANYFLTADKTKLIYSFSSCPNAGAAGIYVIAAP
jgi:hypothetical protein